MIGAVLNANNTRLDAKTHSRYILDHGEADRSSSSTPSSVGHCQSEAIALIGARPILVVDIEDSEGPGGAKHRRADL